MSCSDKILFGASNASRLLFWAYWFGSVLAFVPFMLFPNWFWSSKSSKDRMFGLPAGLLFSCKSTLSPWVGNGSPPSWALGPSALPSSSDFWLLSIASYFYCKLSILFFKSDLCYCRNSLWLIISLSFLGRFPSLDFGGMSCKLSTWPSSKSPCKLSCKLSFC